MSVATAIVLRQLAFAPRTRAQLAERLRRRGCPDQVATVVLDRLTSSGLVDDVAFAQLRSGSRRRHARLGRAGVRDDLRRCGVPEEVVADTVADLDDESERALAEELVVRKLATMRGLDRAAKTRRLAALLARKGFPSDIGYAVVRTALDGDPDLRRD